LDRLRDTASTSTADLEEALDPLAVQVDNLKDAARDGC